MGALGSFTLGIGLSLAACSIQAPETDYDAFDEAGAGGSDSRAESSPGGGSGASGGTTGKAHDNCPDDPSSDRADTDADGQGDVCDEDDDQDGFLDHDDPAPLDTDVPGDFSTPEKVLADPRMAQAIEALREAGFELTTHTEKESPDVTGYFKKEEGVGEFVANSGGGGIGSKIAGDESRRQLTEHGRLESADVAFTSGAPISFAIVTSQTLRGTGNEYTIYTTTQRVCTEAGSNYRRFMVTIDSGKVDGAGNLIDNLSLGVTVATEGELTEACAARANGLSENENEWSASFIPLQQKVEVGGLEYMCVDDEAGYVPTETWPGSHQLLCECSVAYQISCGL